MVFEDFYDVEYDKVLLNVEDGFWFDWWDFWLIWIGGRFLSELVDEPAYGSAQKQSRTASF